MRAFPSHTLPSKSYARASICRSGWRSVKGTLLNAPSLRSVRLPLYPLDSPPLGSSSATPKKGTVEAKASTALFRLPIVPPRPPTLVCDGRELMQGALPPAPPASPRNSRGLRPVPLDTLRRCSTERERSQGFKGGDFSSEKYYPSLDGVERHTALAEGKANSFPLLPHGECGVWGNAPQVKFRVGVRLPFSKGKEDWGAVRRRRGKAPIPSESPVF